MAMTGSDVLALPMDFNDAGATTIRAYLQALLVTLWQEGESFSGKRPFGNSGWEYDLYKALIKGGAIDGTVDEHGDIGTFDTDEANAAVFQAIESLTTA